MFRFGEFTVDPLRFELRCSGTPVRVQRVPLELLLLLLERRGATVDRLSIEERLWGGEVHVDAEHGINTAIRKLRCALGDDPSRPRFIQTVVGRGYRFIAQVEDLTSSSPGMPAAVPSGNGAAAAGQFDRMLTPGARRPRTFVLAVASLVLAAFTVGAEFAASTWRPPAAARGAPGQGRAPASWDVRLVKLAIPGADVIYGVTGPDARQVAYVAAEPGGESLWVRGMDAPGRGRCIVPPLNEHFWGVTYSPAGDFLYYVLHDDGEVGGVLYRVPAPGGSAERLLSGINAAVAFDPGGKRMVFKHVPGPGARAELVLSNADGSARRTLATSIASQPFQSYHWSQDGSSVLSVDEGEGSEGRRTYVTRHAIGRRTPERLFSLPGTIKSLQPLADGNFLALAADPDSNADQLWRLSPGGRLERLTRDTNDYSLVSVAADGRSALATKSETQDFLWVMKEGERPPAQRAPDLRQVLLRIGSYDTPAWGPGGSVLFALGTSLGRSELWWMSGDATEQRQLRPADAYNAEPAASPDGRFVVFTSDRGGARRIWRVNLDDGDSKPLTQGAQDAHPSVSAGAGWVVYASRDGGTWGAWAVRSTGGSPRRLADSIDGGPALSPDEKLLAHAYNDPGTGRLRLAIRSFATGALVHDYPLPPTAQRFQWTADGKGITYLRWNAGSSQLWLQALAEATARCLLRLGPADVQHIDRAPDGSGILMLRRHLKAELVLVVPVPVH